MSPTPSDPTDQELINASGGSSVSSDSTEMIRGSFFDSELGPRPPEAPAGAETGKKGQGLIPFLGELSAVVNLGVSTHKKIDEDNTKVVKSQNDIATRYKMMDIIDKGESQ